MPKCPGPSWYAWMLLAQRQIPSRNCEWFQQGLEMDKTFPLHLIQAAQQTFGKYSVQLHEDVALAHFLTRCLSGFPQVCWFPEKHRGRYLLSPQNMLISILWYQQQKVCPNIWKISFQSLLENCQKKVLNLMFESDRDSLRVFQLQLWSSGQGAVLQDFGQVELI